MRRPSARLLVALGAILTLASGALLAVADDTRVGSGGPYGFLTGFYFLCLAPGVLLLVATLLLYFRDQNEAALAGFLGVGGAMASVPLAFAGFWVGFALALAGSFLVLLEPHPKPIVGSSGKGNAQSSSTALRRRGSPRWAAPVATVLVSLVAILLLCPQTITADLTSVVDLVNDPVAYDLQAAYVVGSGGSSISWEVGASPQSTNCQLGYSYLVNAYVNDSGQVYWYQVGLAFDWGGGSISSSGWGMSYEAFGPDGNSIFPTLYSGAGVADFSGPIDPGDPVVLSLSLGGSSVSFTASDLTTYASAYESYPRAGSEEFGGAMPSQNPGYFTGLLSECYRSISSGGALANVTYQNQGASQAQGGVLVDEIDFSGGRFPYLPSVELAEEHSSWTTLVGTSTFQAYGLLLQYSGNTFVTGSD
jgi:hypothetical protein